MLVLLIIAEISLVGRFSSSRVGIYYISYYNYHSISALSLLYPSPPLASIDYITLIGSSNNNNVGIFCLYASITIGEDDAINTLCSNIGKLPGIYSWSLASAINIGVNRRFGVSFKGGTLSISSLSPGFRVSLSIASSAIPYSLYSISSLRAIRTINIGIYISILNSDYASSIEST